MRKLGKVVALREPLSHTVTFDDEEFGILLMMLYRQVEQGLPPRQHRMERRCRRLFERLVRHGSDVEEVHFNG